MDIPRPRRKPTFRDTPWWHATRQSLISGVLMTVLAWPFVAYLASQLMALSNQQFEQRQMLIELASGGVLMMPYLWVYYFALERIARQKKESYPTPFDYR